MKSHFTAFIGTQGAAQAACCTPELSSPALAKLVSMPGPGWRSSTDTSAPWRAR